MKTIEVTVGRAGTDEQTPARLMVCSEGCCKGEAFHIFVLASGHQHVQCAECGTSYCDGTCGNTDGSTVRYIL